MIKTDLFFEESWLVGREMMSLVSIIQQFPQEVWFSCTADDKEISFITNFMKPDKYSEFMDSVCEFIMEGNNTNVWVYSAKADLITGRWGKVTQYHLIH